MPHEGACDRSLKDMAVGTLTSDHVNYLIWRYVFISVWLVDFKRCGPLTLPSEKKDIYKSQVRMLPGFVSPKVM